MYDCECVCTCEVCAHIRMCKGIRVFVCDLSVCVRACMRACVCVDIVICMCCVCCYTSDMSNGDYHTHTSHHTTACMRLRC